MFSCNYPGVTVPGGNVTKFSMETNFSAFMQDAIPDYKLDMNFKDPADNRTILDFVSDQLFLLKRSTVNVKAIIIEYEELYELLKKNGAKHAKEL